jgi:hypothetical protein
MVKNNWTLRIAHGNIAALAYSPDDPDSVRIVIDHIGTGESFDVQLNQPRLAVKANDRYALSFLARADMPRTICVGCARAREPWSNLGLYKRISLTIGWESVTAEFEASEDEDNARIHFDLGGCTPSVEIGSVTLRRLEDGALVEPGSSERPLRRLTPASRNWGLDRGLPIDRYYIEGFLAMHSTDVRGRVLEIGDDSYTKRFGAGRVTRSDVLHVAADNPHATIVADLADAAPIPSNTFDCVVLTQTLQLVYDVRAAVATVYRILKPGGVVLATVPGISQAYDSQWRDSWYWSFTRRSVSRLFEAHFPNESIQIKSYGNVLVAMSFIDGLATEELHCDELNYHDPDFEVLISVRAVKPLARP